MNLKKESTCQGLLKVNGAQIHDQSLAATADRELSRMLNFREKLQTKPSASCTVLLPSALTLIKEFLVLSFNQWAET